MASAGLIAPATKSLQDTEFKDHLQRLRQTDNYTNLWYVLRTYIFLTFVIGGTIAFYEYRESWGLPWWLNIPITLLAIVLVGAGQHQLSGLAHEASHHILFKHRYFNDIMGDWLTMFPMYSTLHHYRLQHLAHHQFVNDPVRDPDISQLKTSGHWLDFPVESKRFIITLLKQLWIPRLIRFIRVRAQYNSVGTDKNPYLRKGWKPSKGVFLVGGVYLLTQVMLLSCLAWFNDPLLLATLPIIPWLGVMAFYGWLPEGKYHQSRIHPVISSRVMTMSRLTYVTLMFAGLAWINFATDRPTWLYYGLLWVVPIFTSFAFFMILRQIVQHGNGGREWFTNTRVFLVNPAIRFAVFPMGQDYHLPHHVYASVPHYHLHELHTILMEYPEYRSQAVVVDGYFNHRHNPPLGPTVVEVVGPAYAGKAHDIYIDNTVLDNVEVDDRQAIEAEGEAEKARARNS